MKRVLLVQDDSGNRQVMADHLRRAGYHVHETDNARDGVPAAEAESFDLVVMEVELAGTDGLAAVRHLRSNATTRHIPVLAVGASSGDEPRSLPSGCDAYLSRPISYGRFLGEVSRLLGVEPPDGSTIGGVTRAPAVLVVDDEPANRRLLVDLVRREGYRVFEARGGAEALAQVSREQPDIVLLDLMMPEVDGMTVLTELQRRGLLPALPVVVVTADDARETRLDALAAGAADFVNKPIDRLEIASRLRTLLELKRLREKTLENMRSELHESEHRWQIRFEQSPFAEIDWDSAFHLVDCNPAAEALFGFTRADVLGRHASVVVPKSASELLLAKRAQLLAGVSFSSNFELPTQSGGTITCEWHNSGLIATDGRPIGVVSHLLDVTERISLEQQMRAAQRMETVGRLAGGIAHDFNNVLSIIETYTSFVLGALAPDSEPYEDVDIVRNAARRAAGLTRQLLAFSRRQVSVPEALHINKAVEDLGKMVRRIVGEDVLLESVLADGLWLVEMDPSHVEQVILNLVINARDAMPSGGQLTVSTQNLTISHNTERKEGRPAPAGDYVVLRVSDTGVGMDPETQQRMFEPFFTTKEAGKGTGLGLSTVYGIVKQAGGFIWVDSEPGAGTTFSVYLPRTMDTRKSVRPEALNPSLGGSETILVVEDDWDVRRAVKRILRGAGYQGLLAEHGEQALRVAANHDGPIHAVLSDVVMPKLSAEEMVHHLVLTRPGLRVMYMSGYANVAPVENWESRPGVVFLQKPFSPESLLIKLRQLLDADQGSGAV